MAGLVQLARPSADTMLKLAALGAAAFAAWKIWRYFTSDEQTGAQVATSPLPEQATFDALRARVLSPSMMGVVNLPYFGDRRLPAQIEFENRGPVPMAAAVRLELEYNGLGLSSWSPPVLQLPAGQRILVDYLIPFTAPAQVLGGTIATLRVLARLPASADGVVPSKEWILHSAVFVTT